MHAAVHMSVMEEYKDEFVEGSVAILRQVYYTFVYIPYTAYISLGLNFVIFTFWKFRKIKIHKITC